MPRARSKTSSKKSSKTANRRASSRAKRAEPTAASSAKSFVCPECGKTFTRAASLGAHRNRAHGVAGKSAPAKRKTAATSATRAASSRPATDGSRTGRGVDRDRILAMLFPNGIPAREEVIRDIAAWLDHAERLARRRA